MAITRLTHLLVPHKRLALIARLLSQPPAHALADGILGWREGDLPLDALLAEAATPGGIAETVIKTMHAHGHPRMVERGLRAGIARARKNSRRS